MKWAFFIAAHLPVRRGPLTWEGRGRKWELETCPFYDDHTGGCAVVTEGSNGAIGFKCQHNSCADKHWRDVRELFEGPRRKNKLEEGLLTTTCLLDIQAKPVCWLWPGRIARGKLNIIAGNPGLGKSQITASIAAVVTTGGHWPVEGQQCTPGGVLFFSAEDDPADTLRPRLEAVGANLRRVHFINGITVGYSGSGTRSDRAFSLETDVEALDAKLTELGEDFALFESCFPGMETLNGQMLATCNRSAERLARRWNKAIVAGSDAHTLAALGLTYTEVPGAESADAFMDGLKNRAGCARGISGDYWTLTQAVMSIGVSLMRGRAWTVALAPLFLAVPFVILANYAKEHAFNRKWTRRLGGRTILLTPACAPESAA